MDRELRASIAEVENRHWWYEGRRRILSSLISRLPLPRNPRILEAGCGTGANLETLAKFGSVSAFEPDAWAQDIARKRHGDKISIATGALPDEMPYEGPFDLICAMDVIEHIENDLAALKRLCGALSEKGYAIYTVPAYQFLWSRHDELNHHKRRYTRKDFVARLKKTGHDIVFASYYNTFLFPPALAVRIFSKTANSAKPEDSKNEPIIALPRAKLINALLTHIFAAERFFLRFFSFPFGLSIIVICTKKATA